MADYNIIQSSPEKVKKVCMQTTPRPNAYQISPITTINPPCKPEQNVVAIDLVQLRQVLNQALKDVTERLKAYATLENLKEEAETRYSEDLILAEKLKQDLYNQLFPLIAAGL